MLIARPDCWNVVYRTAALNDLFASKSIPAMRENNRCENKRPAARTTSKQHSGDRGRSHNVIKNIYTVVIPPPPLSAVEYRTTTQIQLMTEIMATMKSALKRKHGNDISIISIHGVPTGVPFSLLSNALGFYISQAFCWSIKFVDGSVSSEFIEMYTYDNKLVGRLRLRPRRSHYSRSAFHSCSIFHAENTGTLEIFDHTSNKYYSSTVASVLNDLVAQMPLLVTGFDRTIVKARSLLFDAEDDPFFTGDTTPRVRSSALSVPPYINNNVAAQAGGVYQSNYVSMLTRAPGSGAVYAEYRRRGNHQGNVTNALSHKKSQGKENSYVSMLATNGGDKSTKQELSCNGTTQGKSRNDGSTKQNNSSHRSRAPKVPLGNIVEDREHWQGRI